jgi:23S rRNA pseudouridine1911/1915/1917 synthase
VAGLQRRRLRHLGSRGCAGGRVRLTPKLTVAGEPRRLDVFLASAEPALSRSAAGRLARAHAISINGRPAKPADQVRAGDVVEFDPPLASKAALEPEAIPLEVLYEDDDLMVVVKPAGMVVHPAAGHGTGTLVHALLGHGGKWSSAGGEERPGIVHRLDRGTSGLMLVARNDRAHRALAAQLADRTLSRTYLAIVRGNVKAAAGELEGDIGRDPRDRKRMAVVERGRYARTRYEVVERLRGHTLLRCRLFTGRTHQIRVHLAAFGHPVAGDRQYARTRPGDPPRPMLHAYRLRFTHPAGDRELEFEAAPPADFTGFLESLR